MVGFMQGGIGWVRSLGAGILLAALHASPASAGDYLHPSPTATEATRVQVMVGADGRSVVRRSVTAWNPAPQLDLDYVWEPASGQPSLGLDAAGRIDGHGRLTWRMRGSASYDPDTVFSTYEGTLRGGRPEGKGRLTLRTGESVEGEWRGGRPNGPGVWVDVDGNRYEGPLVDGRPAGSGRLLSTTGEIYSGPFVDGLRDGQATVRLADGTTYASVWVKGIETTARPARTAAGGLVRAQAGGDADRLDIAVAVDERMNQRSEMRYQHLVRDEDIAVYPTLDLHNEMWNGNGMLPSANFGIDNVDWENAPAFVEVDLGTSDGSRARMSGLKLEVATSEVYRKPMLTVSEHMGCVGFRPDFSFINRGWGAVRDAKLTLQFTGEEEGAPLSKPYELPIEGFDAGADISIRSVLDQAGVDTQKLTDKRFPCQSEAALNVCRAQLFNDVGFGEIADHVFGEYRLRTNVAGRLDYAWADDAGNVFQQSEPFRVTISLAEIEVPISPAECGDGFGGSPEALRYIDVPLRLGAKDYTIDLPMRGNRAIAKYTARLKLHAEKSSFHQMRVAASLADGSVRESKPISLYYFRPRPAEFESTSRPPVCYLKPEGGSC